MHNMHWWKADQAQWTYWSLDHVQFVLSAGLMLYMQHGDEARQGESLASDQLTMPFAWMA